MDTEKVTKKEEEGNVIESAISTDVGEDSPIEATIRRDITEAAASNGLDIIPELITIKPVPNRVRFHGLVTDALDQVFSLRVLPNPKTMRYDLSLTDEEHTYMENLFGQSIDMTFNKSVPHRLWDESKIKLGLYIDDIELNPKLIAEDFVKWKIALASDYVANSLSSYEDGEYQHATHYIFNEYEEERTRASKVEQKNSALKKSFEMSLSDKINILKVLDDGKDYTNLSSNIIEVKISDKIEENPSKFLKFAEMKKSELTLRAVIIECVAKVIIRKTKNGFFFRDQYVGFDFEDVINTFKDPKNQEMKIGVYNVLQNLRE